MMNRLYVILGCTASGKASVGLELARRLGGEIVVVDSMKIYRRMNIGTATPTGDAQSQVPHHCIDLVEPSDSFSVADYVRAADDAITEIVDAGKIPLAVGGTSLYLKGLCEGLFEGPAADHDLRATLKSRAETEGLPALHAELTQVDPNAASLIHPNDERRIVRALEVFHTQGVPISTLQQQWDTGESRYDCITLGLRREKEDQSRRINQRVKRMIEMGLVEEVESLLAEPDPLSRQAAAAVGYAELIAHFRGDCSRDEAIEKIKINTRKLAKKQRTWHRRFADVTWFDVDTDDTVSAVADRIQQTICFDTDAPRP
jgi:tRNA dimethylallyltransferase